MWLWCILALTNFTVSAATFKATLDRDTIIIGESVTLTLQFEDAQIPGNPNLPAIPGVRVAGTSTGFSSSTGPDGKTQAVQSFSYTLVPSRAGDVTIPSLSLDLDGRKLSSPALKLKVLQEDPVSPHPQLATNLAFLWLSLPKKEVYVGEAIIAELRLYLRNEVGNIADLNIPPISGDGYNSSKLIQGRQFQRRVGNESFTVIPLSFSLAPVKSGPIKIGPLNGSVLLLGGQRDWFGNYSQRATATLTTEPRTLAALPLPSENVPADFTGAVGSYTMSANIGPTNVATGDPITLRIQISGHGTLDAVTLPARGDWENFKVYPATSKPAETTDQFGLQGSKLFEQVVSPESTEIQQLPAVSFSFFDPETKTYRTLRHPETKLIVRPGGTVSAPSVAAGSKSDASAETPQQRDIVPIKQRLGNVSKSAKPLIFQPAFLAAQSAPLLMFLGAFIWRKRSDTIANNPRLRRRLQAEQTIAAGLKRLRYHAEQNNSEEFFGELVRVLQEKLGERLDCPASAITESVVDDKLRPRGVPDTTLDELSGLFQACNLARYAPVRSSQELTALIPRLETALRQLDEVRL